MPLTNLGYKMKGLNHTLTNHRQALSMSASINPQYLDGHDALLEAALNLQS